MKELAEKKKFEELTREITANSIDQTVDQMKAMMLSDEMVSKVQKKLESDARESVRQIQGDVVYDTVD